MNKRKTSFILATALAASIIMSGCASTAVSGAVTVLLLPLKNLQPSRLRWTLITVRV